MKISFNIRFTRSRRKKNITHHAHDTELTEQKNVYHAHDIKLTEQRNVHYAHNIELIEQKNVYYVHDTEHTKHNVLDTILLCLYNDDRFLK